MDVFYYWKDYKDDIENGMVGRFVSTSKKLGEMNHCPPDHIWHSKHQKVEKVRYSSSPDCGGLKLSPRG